MIRYEFGSAPESEKSEVRKAFERISALAPVTQDVTVYYPVELPKEFDDQGELVAMVRGRTEHAKGKIEISPMVFDTKTAHSEDPKITEMPMACKVSVVEWTAAHEWGHIVTMAHWREIADKLADKPMLSLYLSMFSDLSDYGKSEPAEAVAEAFPEWYLSEGSTENEATRKIAKLLGWPTDFSK